MNEYEHIYRTPEEVVERVLGVRSADAEVVEELWRRGDEIAPLFASRSRLALFMRLSPMERLVGPMGLLGPLGVVALAIAATAATLFELSFGPFVSLLLVAYLALHLAVIRTTPKLYPSRLAAMAERPLGAGILAAWFIQRRQGEVSPDWDTLLAAGIGDDPEYWYDRATAAVSMLPAGRRQRIVQGVLETQPEHPWRRMIHPPLRPVPALAAGAPGGYPRLGRLLRFNDPRSDHLLEALASRLEARGLTTRFVDDLEAAARLGDYIGIPEWTSDEGDLYVELAWQLEALPPSPHRERLAMLLVDLLLDVRYGEPPHFSQRPPDDALAVLQRVVLTDRYPALQHDPDRLLAELPVVEHGLSTPQLRWHDGTPVSEGARANLASLLRLESERVHTPQLVALREALSPQALPEFVAAVREVAPFPEFVDVLLPQAELAQAYASPDVAPGGHRPIWRDADFDTEAEDEGRNRQYRTMLMLGRHASVAALLALDDLRLHSPYVWARDHARRILNTRFGGSPAELDAAVASVAAPAAFDVSHPAHRQALEHALRGLERAMLEGRRFSAAQWEPRFRNGVGSSVVWGAYGPDGRLRWTFRVTEELELVDRRDEPVRHIEPDVQFGVVHRVELPSKVREDWADIFADYEIASHFDQLERPVYALWEEEMDKDILRDIPHDGFDMDRFARRIGERGWYANTTRTRFRKRFERHGRRTTAQVQCLPFQNQLDSLAFFEGDAPDYVAVARRMRLADIDPIIYSEALYDVHGAVQQASLPAQDDEA